MEWRLGFEANDWKPEEFGMNDTEFREYVIEWYQEQLICDNKFIRPIEIKGLKIDDVVVCLKDDPMDDRCNIADDLRWKIGDIITVKKIEILPYGTFLYNSEGHDINIKRVVLKSDINSIYPYITEEEFNKKFDEVASKLFK